MKPKAEKLLKALLEEIKDKESFDELSDQLFKRGFQSLLKAEMNAHLGYPPGEKPITDNQRNDFSKKTLKTS